MRKRYLYIGGLLTLLSIGAASIQMSNSDLLKGEIDWTSIIQAPDPDLARFQEILDRCLENEPVTPFDYRSCPDDLSTGQVNQTCKEDINANKRALISALVANASQEFGTPLTWRKLRRLKGVDVTVGNQEGVNVFGVRSQKVYFDFKDHRQSYEDDVQNYSGIVDGTHDLQCTYWVPDPPGGVLAGSFEQKVNRESSVTWPYALQDPEDYDFVMTHIRQEIRDPNPEPFTHGFAYSFHNGQIFEGYLYRYKDINGVITYDFKWPENRVNQFILNLSEIRSLLRGQTLQTEDGEVTFEYFPAR